MARKLKRYLVGYDDDRQTIYGSNENGKYQYADPMTLAGAKRKVKRDSCSRKLTIYKLVVVRDKTA